MLNWLCVEVEKELGGGRQDDEVAEDRPGAEQHRHHDQEGDDHPALAVGERRQHVGVSLVEDHRQREHDRRVHGDRHGGGEWLGDPERDRGPVAGQRCVGDIQQPAVLPEAEREGDRKRRDRDEDPRAKLVQVLDERDPVLEADRPNPGH